MRMGNLNTAEKVQVWKPEDVVKWLQWHNINSHGRVSGEAEEGGALCMAGWVKWICPLLWLHLLLLSPQDVCPIRLPAQLEGARAWKVISSNQVWKMRMTWNSPELFTVFALVFSIKTLRGNVLTFRLWVYISLPLFAWEIPVKTSSGFPRK